MKLTTLEKQLINAWHVNYDNAEDELEDNAGVMFAYDFNLIMESSKWRGVVSSLQQKGLVYSYEDTMPDSWERSTWFHLTDEGIREHFND